MENSNRLWWIFFGATVYMLFAFGWWTALLIRMNEDARGAKTEVQKLGMQIEGLYQDSIGFVQTGKYVDIERKYDKQRRMIWEEGSVIFIGFLFGIWFINGAHKREMGFANQRRNFILSITHELKSPIASIQLILQTFIKRQLDKSQSDKLSKSALTEAERLNELVNNLLLSAQLETAYHPHFEEISLGRMLEEIVEKMRVKYPNAVFDFQHQEVPIFWGERLGIASVFLNLIENAVKYSKGVAAVRVECRYDSERFLVEVADTGIGILDREKRKIFEKFYRSGNEDTRQTKGTGLGLYIVDQIVKAHGGTIRVVDNKPSGSLFSVMLPNFKKRG